MLPISQIYRYDDQYSEFVNKGTDVGGYARYPGNIHVKIHVVIVSRKHTTSN